MESDQEDLISIGTIGLIKGITTFDASKGARLATYAARCVENAILSPVPFGGKDRTPATGIWRSCRGNMEKHEKLYSVGRKTVEYANLR